MKENYSIFDTSESKYISMELKKFDANLIAAALNQFTEKAKGGEL